MEVPQRVPYRFNNDICKNVYRLRQDSDNCTDTMQMNVLIK